MKMKNISKLVGLSLVASVLFLGCSSDSSSTPASTALTGTFIDAPVEGLSYKTATKSGFTNAQGEFLYEAGEEVELKLGNLSLGKVKASGTMTPYDMNLSATVAGNIALILQNCDGDRANSGSLDVSKLKDFDFNGFDLTANASVLEGKLTTLLATPSFQGLVDESNHDLVTAAIAVSTMDAYVGDNAISVKNGFGAEWLDGRTLYTFAFEDGNEFILTLAFSGTNMSFKVEMDGEIVKDETNSFVISDGMIKWTDDDGDQQWNIVSINSKGIVVPEQTTIAEGIIQSETLTLYFNKADMQTALDAIN